MHALGIQGNCRHLMHYEQREIVVTADQLRKLVPSTDAKEVIPAR
jgi:hypothetical protein